MIGKKKYLTQQREEKEMNFALGNKLQNREFTM